MICRSNFTKNLNIRLLGLLLPLLLAAACTPKDDDNTTDGTRGQVVATTELGTWRTGQIDSASFGLNPFSAQYQARAWRITYKTIDALGVETVASGAIIVPLEAPANLPLVSYQHGTTTKRQSVPSYKYLDFNIVGLGFAGQGYATVMPDYLGLGDGTGFHPYIHAKTEATATIDLIRAARTFLAGQGYSVGSKLFLAGYSQGGHATMATVREIEANHPELAITAAAPMAGPYDLAGAQLDVILEAQTYPDPSYLPYLMLGYDARATGNASIYTLYSSLGDIFKDPWASSLPGLFDGTKATSEINPSLATVPITMVKDSVVVALTTDNNHPIRLALKDNALMDFTPRCTMRMYHCSGDKHVSVLNSQNALAAYQSRGATNVTLIDNGADKDHLTCNIASLPQVKDWFDTMK